MARTAERGGVYRVLVGKPKGKEPLGRSRRRWEADIKIYNKESGWIDLAQVRDSWWAVVNTVMKPEFRTMWGNVSLADKLLSLARAVSWLCVTLRSDQV